MTEIIVDNTKICRFVWDYVDSNAYIIQNNEQAIIIDPVDTFEFWQYLKDKQIIMADVFLTHEHFDHISGLNKLRKKMKCSVHASALCSRNIGLVSRNMSNVANVISQFNGSTLEDAPLISPFVCNPADFVFEQEETFQCGPYKLLLAPTPGHSEGSVCIFLNDSILFSGDTILKVPTITRFPGGNKKAFFQMTVPYLKHLQEKVKYVFPGHGEYGDLREMLSVNE